MNESELLITSDGVVDLNEYRAAMLKISDRIAAEEANQITLGVDTVIKNF